MSKTFVVKIENDDFKPNYLSINLGDTIEICISGFIPADQKYLLTCSEFSNALVSKDKTFSYKFLKPAEFRIVCGEKVWMECIVIVRNDKSSGFTKVFEGKKEIECEPPNFIRIPEGLNMFSEKIGGQNQETFERNIEKTKGSDIKHKQDIKSDTKKTKDKKAEQKFKKKIRTNKEYLEEVVSNILDVIEFSKRVDKDNETVINKQISSYLAEKLGNSKIVLPLKYKEILLKFIFTSNRSVNLSTHTPSSLISMIFNINTEQPNQFFSNLTIEKIENFLESRINLFRLD